jgi:stage V sporulation protein G
MEITGVKIYPFATDSPKSGVLAFAEIEVDGALMIRGIRIIESKNGGLFISYPNIRNNRGDFKPIIIPKDSKTAGMIRNKVIEAYRTFGSTTDTANEEAREHGTA